MKPPQDLQKGSEALKQGRTREARRHLGQYVRDHPDDPQGWWLLAQAVDSVEEKASCAQRTLRLDPDHKEATALLARLRGKVATPTPAAGIARPVLTAREDGTIGEEPPEDDRRDVYVAGAAVLVALFAIVGTVLIVVTGSGGAFGFNPPDSTPTPITFGFGPPACASGAEEASITFINNTGLVVRVTAEGAEELFTLGPGEQALTAVTAGQDIRYTLQADDPSYAGIPASIRVPAGNDCRVPIQ